MKYNYNTGDPFFVGQRTGPPYPLQESRLGKLKKQKNQLVSLLTKKNRKGFPDKRLSLLGRKASCFLLSVFSHIAFGERGMGETIL